MLVGLRKVLTQPDYEIVSCMDCGSAVLFLKGDPRYDLLVFDLQLGVRVLELTPLARSLSHRKHLPVTVVPAMGGRVGNEAADRTAVDEWVTRRDSAVVALAIVRLLRRDNSELLVRA